MKPFVTVMILAGGAGTRMGAERPKQFLSLSGQPVLSHTLAAFAAVPSVSFTVVVTRAPELEQTRALCAGILPPGAWEVVSGGETRTDSSARGLAAVPACTDYVAVHDAARCLILPADAEAVIRAAMDTGAATAAARITDTVKQTEGGLIVSTLDRDKLLVVQTPQVFAAGTYRKALARAMAEGVALTDDNALLERMGLPVTPVFLSAENPKITYPRDLCHAEDLLRARRKNHEEACMRVGHGYDVHRLEAGRRLVLGGVEIPYPRGLAGHSDADVLVHAVMDALLGAAGLPDIGHLFPDSDPAYLGADSIGLLCEVGRRLGAEGLRVGNVDATVIAQAPKLAPYLDQMKRKIAAALGCDDHVVNIKATTEEHLGFSGREEGMAAHAVCLLLGGQRWD